MAIVLVLLAIAAGAGGITWWLTTREPTPVPAPPAPPPRSPTADLIVDPPPPPQMAPDAGVLAAAPDAGTDAGQTNKRPVDTRSYGSNGTIDKRRVSAFIRSRQGEVRRCYERRLKLNNILQGVLDTEITILPSGRVSNVNFTQDTLYDGEVRGCVSRVIRSWQFPEPEGGSVKVSNLFRFEPRTQ